MTDPLKLTLWPVDRDILLTLIKSQCEALVSRLIRTGDKNVARPIEAELKHLTHLALVLELAEFATMEG